MAFGCQPFAFDDEELALNIEANGIAIIQREQAIS